MKSTRERILRTLLSYPGSTINDLAEAVGINGISIRHHLASLEADNLVVSAEERHGVGRPRLIYSLTEKGVEEFPTSYLRLTRRLIAALKTKMAKDELSSLFGEIGSEIAQTYKNDLDGKSIEDRLKMLKKVMTKEGYIIEYEKGKDSYIISSLSCPYYQIAADFSEICNMDQHLISDFLSTPVEIKTCILDGEDRCTYLVPIQEKED
jgi:predicted ArsR family transcriptional regulator